MALDLSGVAGVVEQWLVDEIEVTRDGGVADDHLDEETGTLVPSAPRVVYDGLGAVQPISGFTAVPDPDTQRVVTETGATYRLLLPLAAAASPRVADRVRVKAQHSTTPHPDLLARRWEVVELGVVSSWSVMQTYYLKQLGVSRS